MKKASKKEHEPSRASLKEMPEVDFSAANVRRNPFAKRVAREGISVQTSRGRPRRGQETGTTVPRSIRFPDAVWREIERCAAQQGITLHAALRTAVLEWMARRT